MHGSNAMENSAGVEPVSRSRRAWLTPAGTVAALMAIGLPVALMGADAGREDIVLTRNEAVAEPLGGRTWRGALGNRSDRTRLNVMVRIVFHDRLGRPVGAPLSARAARLDPGARMDLQARLPADAVGMRIHGLRWTAAGRTIERTPRDLHSFGVVQG
jgi:hypothetical protein